MINVLEADNTVIHHYRAKYSAQRDLIVQIILLAKDIYEKWNFLKIQHKNPNTEKFAMESNKKPKIVRQSDLKLINNDRLIPPKSIKKCVVSRKSGPITQENRLFLTLGISQLLISK